MPSTLSTAERGHEGDGDAQSVGPASAATGIGRITLLLYLLLFPAIGVLVACIGFCDPDTCWHLALGKWMFVHHCLPYVDPFSANVHDFVFVNPRLPLMQHEWMSDLMLYGIFALAGARGLLAVTAVLSSLSLAIIPAILMRRNQVPHTVALALILSTVWASAFRLWVRPEAISFLCMSALILINDICLQTRSKRVAAWSTVATGLLMALWTNCHALFVTGIAYLGGYLLLSLFDLLPLKLNGAEVAVQKDGEEAAAPIRVKRSSVLLGTAVVATLCTPWSFALWNYIARVVASPISHANKENGPLTDLASPTSFPLFALLIFFLVIELWPTFKGRLGRVIAGVRDQEVQAGTAGPQIQVGTADPPIHVTSLVLGLAAFVIAVLFRRLTPLALLVVMAAASIMHRKRFGAVLFVNQSNSKLALAEIVGCILSCAGACVIASHSLAAPVIPSPSRLFSPPYTAMQILQDHRPSGRLLNDSKFGSMIAWDWKNPPDIFVDGRFDSFDRNLVRDYNRMRLCQGNWQQLLDRYRISWVFFPPRTPLVIELAKEPGWSVFYSDASAVVLQRAP